MVFSLKKIKIKHLISFTLIVFLTACAGGAKKSKNSADEELQVDMTRPPVTITGAETAAESDPNETVSFEEWKDEREKASAEPEK